MPQHIVIHKQYGSFSLQPQLARQLQELGLEVPSGGYEYTRETHTYDYSVRTDPRLVALVAQYQGQPEIVGSLKVVTIPEDVQWVIDDYDGKEWVAEKHRSWH